MKKVRQMLSYRQSCFAPTNSKSLVLKLLIFFLCMIVKTTAISCANAYGYDCSGIESTSMCACSLSYGGTAYCNIATGGRSGCNYCGFGKWAPGGNGNSCTPISCSSTGYSGTAGSCTCAAGYYGTVTYSVYGVLGGCTACPG